MDIIEKGRQFMMDVLEVNKQYVGEKNTPEMRAALQAHLDSAVEWHELTPHVRLVVEYWEVVPNNVGLRPVAVSEEGRDMLEAWGMVRRHVDAGGES